MDETLELDLNELVTKKIADKIKSLESEITSLREENAKKYKEMAELKEKANNSKIVLELLDHIRQEYAAIKQSEPDKDGYYDNKHKNQYHYIEKILLHIFNVKSEANGWYSSRSDGALAPHLAVNFYSHKDIVIKVLGLLAKDSHREIAIINSFKMPYDYTKQEVIEYVTGPKYNTNGNIFGISRYWVEHGIGKENMPHDLIMQNPHILDPDVFALMIGSIKKGVPNYNYFFALPLYNKNITDEHIKTLGYCLPAMPNSVLNYNEVNRFILDNLKKFETPVLEFFYNLISSDNQFKTLHWERFPNDYQARFLGSKSIDDILKIFTTYHCTWTSEEKQNFLKHYTNLVK